MADRAVNLYTIPSSQHFLKKLAEGLWERADGDQNRLSRMRVLLPTRRASRGLRDAFLEIFDHKAVLLPRLQPLSDIDESELDLTLSGLGLDISDVPPAIRPLERQFLLAQLVKIKSPETTTEQSLVLANKLSSLMDQVHTEGLDFSALKNLVDDSTLSTHWQETIEFLDIVTTNWPEILKARGQIDPSERRARLMKTLTDLWSHTPPAHPVIAAGSTGSIPTTANLLETIARMTNGSVILPGLDLEMDDKSWNRIDDTHPQRTMKNLLDRIGITRKDVALWPTCGACQINTPRQRLCRDIMRSAETFGRTIPDQDMIDDLKTGITICETENPREHASTIATAIRIALETPKQTVCFVTPDRPLARRVTTALKRWGIEADDSAGQSLATTQSGILILTFIRLLEEQFAPIPFLELLKHPLSAYRHISATELAAFEILILRGPKPAAGWDGLRARFNNLKDYEQKTCAALFEKLDREFSPFELLVKTTAAPKTMIETLIAGFEQICGESGIAWGQEESQTLSSFLSELLENAATLPSMTFGECANMLRTLLSQETFRKTESRHPRLVILGQLEARLIRHDVMILSGLNEGLWPSEPGHDPFMSRPMRQKFGLPPAGRSIGLSAHDFTEALQANQVILTRAIKENGTETVPARWLQRLKTLLRAAHHEPDWTNTHLIEWTRQLDRHQENLYTNTEAPEPRPPRTYRPQELSATWIEKWMKNPYHVYAAKILNLKPAPKLEENLIHADKGTLIHDTLEEFIKKTSDYFPTHDDAKILFLDLANRNLQQLESLSPQWHYWAPRLPHIAEWVVTQESEWRKTATPWMLEQTGRYRIYHNQQTGREFSITAKADRIDRIKGGSSAAIIDYKTGTPPSQTKIMTGHAPQLAIEALILSKGGYPTSPLETSLLAYWKIDQSGKVTDLTTARDIKFERLVPDAEEGISELVSQFEDPLTPYTALPLTGRLYDDEKAYAHLARMAEWAIAGNTEDETGEAA